MFQKDGPTFKAVHHSNWVHHFETPVYSQRSKKLKLPCDKYACGSQKGLSWQTNLYGLHPLPSSSPSPFTMVAHASHPAASVLFDCSSSRISKCSLRALSESLCVCGKQSASSVCYCTSPSSTASTHFQLKVEEGGRRGIVKSTPQLDK